MRRGRNETGVCLTCWREFRGRSDGGRKVGLGRKLSPHLHLSSALGGMGWDGMGRELGRGQPSLCPAHPPALSRAGRVRWGDLVVLGYGQRGGLGGSLPTPKLYGQGI